MTKKKLRKQHRTLAAAKRWRTDTLAAIHKGERRVEGHASPTVEQACSELIAGMRDGSVLTRSEKPYEPSTVESYAQAVEDWIVPSIGHRRLATITKPMLRDLTDTWRKDPRRPSAGTIRNAIMPLRVVLRRADDRGTVPSNPARGFKLAAAGRRERVANAGEVADLLAALPVDLAALYGIAFHAGLRAGEIAALRWSDLEVEEHDGELVTVIRVRESWCWRTRRFIAPKSDAGADRQVPVSLALEKLLEEHRRAQEPRRTNGALIFGPDGERVFSHPGVRDRAMAAWRDAPVAPLACDRDPDLEHGHISLHEARHSYVSLMLKGRIDPVTVAKYAGHSSAAFTLSRYAKYVPGPGVVERARVDAALEVTA